MEKKKCQLYFEKSITTPTYSFTFVLFRHYSSGLMQVAFLIVMPIRSLKEILTWKPLSKGKLKLNGIKMYPNQESQVLLLSSYQELNYTLSPIFEIIRHHSATAG